MSEESHDEQKLGDEDIAALLDQDEEEEAGTETSDTSSSRVEEYDFLEPGKYNRSELEKLKGISSNIPQHAAQPLSRLMQTKVTMQLASCDQTMWQYMVEDFGDDIVGYSFRVPPKNYRGLLTANRSFCGACLEVLTGAEEAEAEPEEITAMDARVFSHVVKHILEPLPDLWSELGDFSIELKEFIPDLESGAPFSPGEDVLQLCLLAEGEFGAGDVMICVPFEMVRDLPQLMEESNQAGSQPDEETRRMLREKVQQVPVDLEVELGRALLPARDILQLSPGDAVVLGTSVDEPLNIRVNNEPKLKGRPVRSQGSLAIKIEGDLRHDTGRDRERETSRDDG